MGRTCPANQKQKGGKCKRQIEKRGMGAFTRWGVLFLVFLTFFSFIYVFLDTKQNLTSNNVLFFLFFFFSKKKSFES